MNPQRLILVTVAIAIVAIAAIVLVPRMGGGASAAGTDLALETQPRMGDDAAPVELVFFEDFLCPHCATFTENVVPRLEREYVDTGDAKVYFVNFVVLGPESQAIAAVGECVAEGGDDAFWAFEEVAFRSQDDLDERLAIDLAHEYVPDLNAAEFDACLEEGRGATAVRDDGAIAQELGIGGTPAVLVNGEEVSATYEAISRAIDDELGE